MKKKIVVVGAMVLTAVAIGVIFMIRVGVDSNGPEQQSNEVALKGGNRARGIEQLSMSNGLSTDRDVIGVSKSKGETMASEDDSAVEEPEPQTDEERREAEEEALVDAFDDLTDKWMEPSSKGVTMADVNGFVKSFRKIPQTRQDECVHRALNLIPDENVMLLAGVLMDKTMNKEIVETVYNDILNRDEDVKKPILQEIFKDKSHPCWADTAWILDVTGELRKAK